MQIFESGESVAKKVQGGNLAYNTYACMSESSTENMDEAFQYMKNYLSFTLSFKIVSENIESYSVKLENGDEYTLCHERMFESNKMLKCVPSNILRHIISRPFTKDCLYYDEEGQVVDLTTKAKKDVGNYAIRLNLGFITEFENNPDIILDILKGVIFDRYKMYGDIEDYFCGNYRIPQKRLTNKNGILEQLFDHNSKQMLMILEKYLGLHRYFYDYMRLKFKPILPEFPKIEETPKQEYISKGILNWFEEALQNQYLKEKNIKLGPKNPEAVPMPVPIVDDVHIIDLKKKPDNNQEEIIDKINNGENFMFNGDDDELDEEF